MSNSYKLSLSSAIFINLNIMAGVGLFINTVILTQKVGVFGSSFYLLVGLFMFPLVYSIAQLVKKHPSGGFYSFTKGISPFFAFISCWSYFFGKLASASLVVYVAATFFKQLFPIALESIDTLYISMFILSIFTYLNILNVAVSDIIQKLFFTAKSIPILSMIAAGLYTYNYQPIIQTIPDSSDIFTSIPLVLYCLAGFESACSISRNIKNPETNAPKAIFYSFFTVICIYTIFQFFTSSMLISNIDNFQSYNDTFPYMINLLRLSPVITEKLSAFITFLVGFSALGGAYGLLFSIPWNLYTLAEYNHTFFPKQLTKKNAYNIPAATIFIESAICLLLLLITSGSQIPLQKLSAFGLTTAYTISIISLIIQEKNIGIAPYLALITCLGFIGSCMISALTESYIALLLFFGFLLCGCIMFFTTKKRA